MPLHGGPPPRPALVVQARGPKARGASRVFGFAAGFWRAAPRGIAESVGGKWLVETGGAAVLELGSEQAVVEAQGRGPAWSWACRVPRG